MDRLALRVTGLRTTTAKRESGSGLQRAEEASGHRAPRLFQGRTHLPPAFPAAQWTGCQAERERGEGHEIRPGVRALRCACLSHARHAASLWGQNHGARPGPSRVLTYTSDRQFGQVTVAPPPHLARGHLPCLEVIRGAGSRMSPSGPLRRGMTWVHACRRQEGKPASETRRALVQ